MSRLAILLSCVIGLGSMVAAADSPPTVTILTVPTTTESLTTFTSAGVSTSIIPGSITNIVTTIGGNPVTIASVLTPETTIISFTSISVSTIIINSNAIFTSTIAGSKATNSDDPATKLAVSVSVTTSTSHTSVTDAPNLSTSTSETSTSISSATALSTDTQSSSRSSVTTASSTASKPATTSPKAGTLPQNSPSKAGLTAGQKAGIGAGVAIGVILLLVLVAVIILWRHGLLSRKKHADDVFDENEDFLHRPYSMLFSQKKQIEVHHDKPESATQHIAYGPNARLSNPVDLSGTTIHEHADEGPVYLGVPSHLSGQKRWSKVPQGEA